MFLHFADLVLTILTLGLPTTLTTKIISVGICQVATLCLARSILISALDRDRPLKFTASAAASRKRVSPNGPWQKTQRLKKKKLGTEKF